MRHVCFFHVSIVVWYRDHLAEEEGVDCCAFCVCVCVCVCVCARARAFLFFFITIKTTLYIQIFGAYPFLPGKNGNIISKSTLYIQMFGDSTCFFRGNTTDPDQTPRFAASDLGLFAKAFLSKNAR